MPTLYILAGPNGAGKTTFYFTAVGKKFIDKALPFINTDLVVKNELGGYTEENFVKADAIVRSRIAKYVSNKEDFMIESNLAKQSDYDWLKTIRGNGYNVVLYFLCTSNVEINKSRVKKRVKEGGHDVPENIIADRYNMALIYLRKEILDFTEVHLIENSGETAKEIAVVKRGKLMLKTHDCPQWANKILFFVEKLDKK